MTGKGKVRGELLAGFWFFLLHKVGAASFSFAKGREEVWFVFGEERVRGRMAASFVGWERGAW